MMLGFELRGAGLRYDDGTQALDGIDLAVSGGTILGLIGRNGSGKTTLMGLVASLRRPTAGAVLVDGADPWEDASRMASVALTGAGGESGDWKVEDALQFAGWLRPSWDDPYARRLVERFEIPNVKTAHLSRGKRAALRCVMGLAARAPITMYDEAHLGMDAPSRYAFYDEVLADFIARPRTIVLSTHHIDEVASLFSHVAILDRGRLLAYDDTEQLRARGTEVTGPAEAVDAFISRAGVRVLRERRLGGTKAAATFGELDADGRRRAAADGLELAPIALQDLFVHLTGFEHEEVTR